VSGEQAGHALAGGATSPGLELEGVSDTYAGARSPSLRDVTLRLEPGRVLGIAGANESGKTTLGLVVSGLAPRTIGGRLGGSRRLAGPPAGGGPGTAPSRDRLATDCGMLFQHAAAQLTHAAPTVFEEVAFGPCNLGLALPEVVERVWWGLRAVGIEALAQRDPARLSGGQIQLVALAGVLALRPRYLVLDEPTSELDPAGTALVADAIGRVASETGAGVLLVEHKTEVLARIADEMVVLESGRAALSGPAAEVLADPRLAELGVEVPARLRLERRLRVEGIKWTAAVGEALA